ncbi:MAG: phage head closure protein [Micrococcaceae bacterium]|nr:phage head closure protein [Micrococcaceae bacterium]
MIPPGLSCAIGAYAGRLMVDAKVWRKETVSDGGGGFVVDWVDQQRTVELYLTQPSESESLVAAQKGVTITHSAVLPLDSDLKYGDRIELDGETYQLQSDPLTATHSTLARATVRKTPFDENTE